MKNFLNVLGCLVVLAVAAFVGEAFGFYKVLALDNASRYGAGMLKWAQGGFKGSPTDAIGADNQPAPTPDNTQAKAELAQLVAESKKRAVQKYPDLLVSPSEMNSRFVFRYNWMSKENNPRLQEPNWPETLADECAAAAKVRAKPSGGPVTSSKKLVATSAQ